MKIREILAESRTGSLQDDVAKALPAAFTFPTLQNTDPYTQYRFGLAVASARRQNDPDPYNINPKTEFAPTSAWGENLVVVTYDQDQDAETLKLAAKMMGVSKKRISSTKSQETADVDTQSPIKPVK